MFHLLTIDKMLSVWYAIQSLILCRLSRHRLEPLCVIV